MAEAMSNWGAAVRGVGVQFREFFNQADLSGVKSWDPVVKTITDDGAEATFSGKTGAGVLARFSEGSTVPKANRFKLFDTTFSHEQYGKQIEVTRKQLMNRDWNEAFDEFKDLVNSAGQTKSKAPAQIFNNGFTTNSTSNGVKVVTYNDGKALTMNSAFKTLSDYGKALIRVTLSKQAKAGQLQRLSERALVLPVMRQSELCV